MPDTLPSFEINNEWQALSVLTDGGVEIGVGATIQNQSQTRIYAAIAAEQPSADFMGIIIPTVPDRPLIVPGGENEVWLRTRGHGTATVNAQVG